MQAPVRPSITKTSLLLLLSLDCNPTTQVVGCLALYALHRRLLPRNVKPDSSLHRAMWAVQKTVPMVVLGPKTVLFVGEFLAQHAPLEVSRLDPPNPVAHRRTALAAFDGALGPQAAAAAAQCSAWCVFKTPV